MSPFREVSFPCLPNSSLAARSFLTSVTTSAPPPLPQYQPPNKITQHHSSSSTTNNPLTQTSRTIPSQKNREYPPSCHFSRTTILTAPHSTAPLSVPTSTTGFSTSMPYSKLPFKAPSTTRRFPLPPTNHTASSLATVPYPSPPRTPLLRHHPLPLTESRVYITTSPTPSLIPNISQNPVLPTPHPTIP